MVLGFVEKATSMVADSVENAVDVTLGVLTFNELGRADKKTISRMAADGMTVFAISSATGFAVEVVEQVLSD